MSKRKAVAGVVIGEDGRFLAVKKKEGRGWMSGKWHFPGGTLEKRENHKKALIREIREETGIEVVVGKYIAHHLTPHRNTMVRWYECHAYNGDLRPGSDVDEAMWVGKDDVVSLCITVVYLWPEEVRKYFS